jgi:hypothetical protein
VPGQRFEQPGRAGHRERQDQPVGLRQGQRAFRRLAGRALVAELTPASPAGAVPLQRITRIR